MDILFPPLQKAVFLERKNRFLALVKLGSEDVLVHVPNSGRMGELLFPNSIVLLAEANRLKGKTRYDLLLVEKNNQLIDIKANHANEVVKAALRKKKIPYFQNVKEIKSEVVCGSSRFDFYLNTDTESIWLEIKSVNLVVGETAMFPDAPTARGSRHVQELLAMKKQGHRTAVVFAVLRSDAKVFKPNSSTDPQFAKVLKEAKIGGVEIYAYTCSVNQRGMTLNKEIPIILDDIS